MQDDDVEIGQIARVEIGEAFFNELDIAQARVMRHRTRILDLGGIVVDAEITSGFIARGKYVQCQALAATKLAIGEGAWRASRRHDFAGRTHALQERRKPQAVGFEEREEVVGILELGVEIPFVF